MCFGNDELLRHCCLFNMGLSVTRRIVSQLDAHLRCWTDPELAPWSKEVCLWTWGHRCREWGKHRLRSRMLWREISRHCRVLKHKHDQHLLLVTTTLINQQSLRITQVNTNWIVGLVWHWEVMINNISEDSYGDNRARKYNVWSKIAEWKLSRSVQTIKSLNGQ